MIIDSYAAQDEETPERDGLADAEVRALNGLLADVPTSEDDHAVLGRLASDVTAALEGTRKNDETDPPLERLLDQLAILTEIHERPTPWSGRRDEPDIWARALHRLAEEQESAFGNTTVLEAAVRLSGAADGRALEAQRRLEGLDPESRRATLDEWGEHLTEIDVARDALAAANRPLMSPAERWEIFKDGAGLDAQATDRAIATYMRSDLDTTTQWAEQLAERLDDRGANIAVGRDDTGADYTILTAMPLISRTYTAMLRQETENRETLDNIISVGRSSGAGAVRGMRRENALANQMNLTLENDLAEDRRATGAQIQELEELLRTDLQEEPLRERLRELMVARRAEGHPALDDMSELDREQQTDLETITRSDLERGASQQNNRPPVYEAEATFEQNADAVERYIEPRLARAANDLQAAGGVRSFGETMAEPYVRGENEGQSRILRNLRDGVAGSFELWTQGLESQVGCAEAVVRLMKAQSDLAGYEPSAAGGDDPSGLENTGLETAGLRRAAETGTWDEYALSEIYDSLGELQMMDQWLKERDDERALNEPQRLHVYAIENAILRSADATAGPASEAAREAEEMISSFEPPAWRIPESEENDSLQEEMAADRAAAVTRFLTRERRNSG